MTMMMTNNGNRTTKDWYDSSFFVCGTNFSVQVELMLMTTITCASSYVCSYGAFSLYMYAFLLQCNIGVGRWNWNGNEMNKLFVKYSFYFIFVIFISVFGTTSWVSFSFSVWESSLRFGIRNINLSDLLLFGFTFTDCIMTNCGYRYLLFWQYL